jgi:hypothetical protein
MKGKNMRKLIISVAALACCFAASAVAQDEIRIEGGPVPRFVVLPAKPAIENANPPVTLPTWNGSFTYNSTTYHYNMVGTAPSTGSSTTVKAFIIPVKIDCASNTFDPRTTMQGGESVVQQTVESPIFQKRAYVLGGTNIGTTQYEDAFQRANFWGTVKNHMGYHVLLGGPTILPELTLSPGSSCAVLSSNPFGGGGPTALVDINYIDPQFGAYLTAHSVITPDSLPIFITVNTYLTGGSPILNNCCIGGYHSANGAQAYSHFTYIPITGDFSQDVSALSHEVGEWMDDPLVVNPNGNPVACGILEVGDPEEGFANFGDFPYTLGGFTYHIQDLVFLEYFGAPNTTSVHGWETFHNNPFGLGICTNGG